MLTRSIKAVNTFLVASLSPPLAHLWRRFMRRYWLLASAEGLQKELGVPVCTVPFVYQKKHAL